MNPIQNNIKSVLNLENLPLEEQQETLLRIGGIIYQNVLLRVMETMSDSDQDEFEKILDADGTPEKIFGFLKEKNPHLEEIIEQEAVKFKDKSEYIMSQIGN